jgi:hypothetical protein
MVVQKDCELGEYLVAAMATLWVAELVASMVLPLVERKVNVMVAW